MRLVHWPNRRLLGCLLVLLVYEAAAGSLLVLPWVRAARPLAAGPMGDRVLFGDPSGVLLLELGRLVLPALRQGSSWLPFGVVALLGVLPLAPVLVAVAGEGALFASSVRLLPRLVLLSGASTLAQALFGAALFLGGQRLAGVLEPGRWADPASAVVFGLVAALVLAIGVVSDVARVASARGAGLYGAVEQALQVVSTRSFAVLSVFSTRGALGVALVVTGTRLARELLGGPGWWSVGAALVVGELGLFASILLRADALRFAADELAWLEGAGDRAPLAHPGELAPSPTAAGPPL